ncbi:MAG: MarR family transcriptional regulator [Pigmentiphaga sp.]|uniref:MarR family winged helix-turn-helix transcriptional regulator n=1 Tax=Pigmentiphaga sp. TaxID=1977564 RepID=UPI0029AA5C49|nr:MarR family transcriptional regulator [Pigmentiphaga sp.]MDX3907274.1 MarR family transcriptional regulator [Pigmentiphaga sp.]
MQPNSLSPVQDEHVRARLGRLVGAVYRKWRRSVDQEFKEMGLSDATRAPLLALYESKAPAVRQKDLAETLSLEKSSLVRILSQLRQMGLIEWEAAEDDRRAKAIRLTPQGRLLAERILARSMEIEQRILADLTADELRMTRLALEKIARRFDTL